MRYSTKQPKSNKIATSKLVRHPDWLKVRMPQGDRYHNLKKQVREHKLHTVCESASCPNIGECWSHGTLTIMIMGEICTRACRFCDVPSGKPLPLDPNEPSQVAQMLKGLNLKYAVITSVDRDDVADEGAGHWAETIRAVREACPTLQIETLIPDFHARPDCLDIVCGARPDVLSHNLETVKAFQKKIRLQANYEDSLAVLKYARERHGLVTKTGLMLGMGETQVQVLETMEDIARTGCEVLTLGQYLRPSRQHQEVLEYITPEQFKKYEGVGYELGFRHVESGPLVRSSYRADKLAALLNPSK